MHSPIGPFIAEGRPLVLDGALATELERRGADLNDPLWSARCLLESPQLVRAVHLDYFEAGADLATTATYQATFESFARRGIDRKSAAGLMRGAVALAIAAREEFWADHRNHTGRLRPLVAASVGPYGAMLADGSEYRGHYGLSEQALAELEELLSRMRGRTRQPLVAYPNSGERYDASTKRWSHAPSELPFAARAQTWYRAGARLIGGCCRTTPADIRALRGLAVVNAP